MEVAAAAAVAALGAWVVHRRANRFRGAFIGYCSAGLERRAAEEVESLPGGTVLAAWRPAGNGRAIMGTVLFRLEDPTLATGLRAFQQVEALVTVAGGVPSGREEGPAFIFVRSRPMARAWDGSCAVPYRRVLIGDRATGLLAGGARPRPPRHPFAARRGAPCLPRRGVA